jgi:hypothetical protein
LAAADWATCGIGRTGEKQVIKGKQQNSADKAASPRTTQLVGGRNFCRSGCPAGGFRRQLTGFEHRAVAPAAGAVITGPSASYQVVQRNHPTTPSGWRCEPAGCRYSVLTRRGFIQRDGDFGVVAEQTTQHRYVLFRQTKGAHAEVSFDREASALL